ncbi:MAG: hypothetical protein M0T85_15675 [Dehalococcoidales bacterium]|nr:hypothetical protein [Dehalococcoidales bacterium]
MGRCSYCGKDAGFLRSAHGECKKKHEAAAQSLIAMASQAIIGGDDPTAVDAPIHKTALSGWVQDAELQQLLVSAWETAVEQLLTAGILTADKETVLTRFAGHYQLARPDLDVHGAYSRVVKAAVLRDLLEGKIPTRVKFVGTLPFLFQKGESLVWVFTDTGLFQYKTSRQYVGRNSGFSVRVAKGVYYHIGGFKGHSVEQTNLVPAGYGTFAVTSRNIYFGGTGKSFRIPYSKMISIEPYDDGVGITRDTASAKEQVFVTGDGWFTFNLIKNLASIE